MKIKMFLLVTFALIGGVTLGLYFNKPDVQPVDTADSIQTDTQLPQPKTHPISKNTATADITASSQNNDNNTAISMTADATTEPLIPASKPDNKAFYNKFNTEQDINDVFIRHDDAIYQTALMASFQEADFSELIEALGAVVKDDVSQENELQLSSALMQQFGAVISNEKYSCAGRICAVMFNYPPDLEKDSLKNLHKYGSHYSFYNHSLDDYGNPVMKAIFVSTDDPSKLTIAR